MKTLLILISSLVSSCAVAAILPASFSIDFNQVHKSLLKKRKKVARVKLDYQYPSQIVLETGDETKYVSNGRQSWYYTAPFIPEEPGEVVIKKKADLGLLKFFDSLRKSLENNTLFTVKDSKHKLSFSFSKKGQKDLGLRQAVFHLKSKKKIDQVGLGDIEKISLFKTNKKNLDLVIKKVSENVSFPNRHFYFKAPANTKIVHR